MTTYVKKNGSDTWHWMTNCRNYPTNIGASKQSRPHGDLCNECKAKEKK
jgi:hypothetical protein